MKRRIAALFTLLALVICVTGCAIRNGGNEETEAQTVMQTARTPVSQTTAAVTSTRLETSAAQEETLTVPELTQEATTAAAETTAEPTTTKPTTAKPTTAKPTTAKPTTAKPTTTKPTTAKPTTAKPTTAKPTTTKPTTTKPTTTKPTTTKPKTTVPATNSMRVLGYSSRQLLDYFQLTAFNGEDSTHIGRVVKWEKPVYLYLGGNYTGRDIKLLNALCDTLNKIKGFPGISITDDAEKANVYMFFAGSLELSNTIVGFGLLDDGYCGLSWNENYAMQKAAIGINSAMINRAKRDSVISEELLQAMGLPNDSYAYRESVFYQGSDSNSWPSNLDWGLVTILYNTGIKAGMTESEAMRIAEKFVKDGV